MDDAQRWLAARRQDFYRERGIDPAGFGRPNTEHPQRAALRAILPGAGPARDPVPLPAGPPPGWERPPFRASRLRKYHALMLQKAEAILERGSVVIETNGDTKLTATLHRFPDGSAALETEHRWPWGGGSGSESYFARGSLDAASVAPHLESAFMTARVRPVADQEI